MTTPLIWTASVGVILLLIVLAYIVTDNHRKRRQIDSLMTRLEQVESRLAFGEDRNVEDLTLEESVIAEASEYSADVLAGRSSYVAQLVSDSSRPAALADQAVVSVYRRIQDPIRPSDLAGELFVSLRTLERGLARALECTPTQLILTVKMREARRLIASGQFRVGEVAHHLAFSDAAHLSRRYRKFYRCPPSEHVGERAESVSIN